jgi:hypothetical protein
MLGHADNGIKSEFFKESFMPILACCTKGKFYAKSALLYSKGHLYANDVSGIKLPHVYDLAYSIKGKFLCQGY